jgi:hypothetical protein
VGIAWVFALGGLLELIGLSLVAWDVLDAYLGVSSYVPKSMKERLRGKMWNRHTEAAATAEEDAEVRAIAAGNIPRRAFGVLVFAVGVVVQTAANIVAL